MPSQSPFPSLVFTFNICLCSSGASIFFYCPLSILCDYSLISSNFIFHVNIISIPRGPESEHLLIEDADKAVATVTGLVAGVYTFKLTVTDAQKESNSATTQVVVKEGQWD